MRESRTYGFVRGVSGDWHPYRDSQTFARNSLVNRDSRLFEEFSTGYMRIFAPALTDSLDVGEISIDGIGTLKTPIKAQSQRPH